MAESRKPLGWLDLTFPPINLYNLPKTQKDTRMKKILVRAQAVVELTRVTWMPDDSAELFMESEDALKMNLDERDCKKILEITSVSAREIE